MQIDLSDRNKNYLIISSYKEGEDEFINQLNVNKLETALYLRDYTVIDVYNGSSKCFLAHKDSDCNDIRYDAIELMYEFKQEFVIVKYKEEETAKKITYEGMEYPLGIVEYQGDSENHNFFIEGKAISFEPQKRYFYPKTPSDFKKGMIVEYKNNNHQWVEQVVMSPQIEYDRMYKLLIKYDKIRIKYNENL